MTDDPNAASQENQTKRTRHRSPNYPGFGLREAVSKIRVLYKADGLAAANKMAALKHLGYDKLHGEAGRTLSALKAFDLVSERDNRIKLTQNGIDIVVRPDGDAVRQEALRKSAQHPEVYAWVLKHYAGSGLPGDESLKAELKAVKKFNRRAVDGFVKDFRDTLVFSGLSANGVVDSTQDEGDEAEESDRCAVRVGDYVQWESQGVLQFPEPLRVRALTDDGEWAFVDGSETGMPVDELTIQDAPREQPKKAPTLPLAVGDQLPPMDDSAAFDLKNAATGQSIRRQPEMLTFRLPQGSRVDVRFSGGVITQKAIDKLIAFLELGKDTYPIEEEKN